MALSSEAVNPAENSTADEEEGEEDSIASVFDMLNLKVVEKTPTDNNYYCSRCHDHFLLYLTERQKLQSDAVYWEDQIKSRDQCNQSLVQQMEVLKQDNEKLKSELLKEGEKFAEVVKNHNKRIREKNKKCSDLTKENDNLRAQVNKLQQENLSNTEALNTYRNELQTAHVKNQELQNLRRTMDFTLTILRAKNSEWEQQYAAQQQEIGRLSAGLARENSEKQMLAAELAKRNTENHILTAQLQSGNGDNQRQLERMHHDTVERLNNKDREISNYEEKLSEERAKNRQLQDALAKEKSDNQKLTADFTAKNNENQRLTIDLTLKNKEIERLSTELVQYNKENQRLTDEVAQKNEDNKRLSVGLEEEKGKNQKLTTDLEEGQSDKCQAIELWFKLREFVKSCNNDLEMHIKAFTKDYQVDISTDTRVIYEDNLDDVEEEIQLKKNLNTLSRLIGQILQEILLGKTETNEIKIEKPSPQQCTFSSISSPQLSGSSRKRSYNLLSDDNPKPTNENNDGNACSMEDVKLQEHYPYLPVCSPVSSENSPENTLNNFLIYHDSNNI